jgi:hypothetical protein
MVELDTARNSSIRRSRAAFAQNRGFRPTGD